MRKINLSIKVKKTRKIIIEITNTEKRKIELKRQKLINTKDDMSHVYMEASSLFILWKNGLSPFQEVCSRVNTEVNQLLCFRGISLTILCLDLKSEPKLKAYDKYF